MVQKVGGGNSSTVKVWDDKEREFRRDSRIAELVIRQKKHIVSNVPKTETCGSEETSITA